MSPMSEARVARPPLYPLPPMMKPAGWWRRSWDAEATKGNNASAHNAMPRTRRGSARRDAIAADELASEARPARPPLSSLPLLLHPPPPPSPPSQAHRPPLPPSPATHCRVRQWPLRPPPPPLSQAPSTAGGLRRREEKRRKKREKKTKKKCGSHIFFFSLTCGPIFFLFFLLTRMPYQRN